MNIQKEIEDMVNKNFIQRLITSLVLIPVVLMIIYLDHIFFSLFVVFVAVLMAFEWYSLTIEHNKKNAFKWKLAGLLYIGAPCISLIWLSQQPQGSHIITWLMVSVWATDVCAYLAGNLIGGPKLVPKISPNKTWSGLLGGMCGAMIVGFVAAKLFESKEKAALVILSVILAIYAQVGDIIESWIKRKFKIKDSGSLLPGHGGVLDRVDGLVITAPKVALVVFLENWNIF